MDSKFSDLGYTGDDTTHELKKKANHVEFNTVTTDYTLVAADQYRAVEVNSSSDVAITVPTSTIVNFPIGTSIPIIRYGSGAVEIVEGGLVTVRSDGDDAIIPTRYKPVVLVKRALNEWYLWGIGGAASGGGGGDVTAPGIFSITAIDATHIEVVFNESVTVTTLGWSFEKGGVDLPITSVSGSGTTWTFLVATMASGDTLTYEYNSTFGNTLDGSSNELPSGSGSVTNSITPSGDADVDAYETRLGATANPYTFATGQKARVEALITAMKSAGVYDKLHDFGFLHLGTHKESRELGFKNVANGTYVSGFTFSNSGSTPAGASVRFDLGVSPDDLPQDAAGAFVVTDDDVIVNLGDCMLGLESSSNSFRILQYGGNMLNEVNSSDGSDPFAFTPVKGYYSIFRTNSTTEKTRVNGSTVDTRTVTSAAPSSQVLGLGSIKTAGGGNNYHSTRRIQMWGVYSDFLTDSEDNAFKAALKTFFDAEGITAIP